MGKQSFFIWNGVDCRSMGVRLLAPVPIVRPEERVEHITIPGRAGDLTQLEGEDIYNSYIQTANIAVHSGNRVREIFKWLRGAGYVTFSGEPDRKHGARIIGAITQNKHSHNLDWWTGEVQFYCRPFKQRLLEETVTISAASTLYNDGDAAEKPVIIANFTAGATITITSSSGTFTVDMTGRSETAIRISCEAEEVTTTDGNTLLTVLSSGDFPRINEGSVAIGGSGWSSLQIQRARRYL